MNRKERRKQQSTAKKLKPGLYAMTTSHDEWCLFYNGQGDCNCNPEYKMVSYEDKPKEFIKNNIETAQINNKEKWWNGKV